MAFGTVTIIDDGGINVINTLVDQVNQLQAEFAALLTLYNTHTHGGITAGAGTSAVPGGSFLATATKTGKTTLKK
jgi:hypothetical protein